MHPGATPSPDVVRLPADPTGPALAAVVRQVRAAIVAGDAVVDSRDVQTWSVGVIAALERLERRAHLAGARWTLLR